MTAFLRSWLLLPCLIVLPGLAPFACAQSAIGGACATRWDGGEPHSDDGEQPRVEARTNEKTGPNQPSEPRQGRRGASGTGKRGLGSRTTVPTRQAEPGELKWEKLKGEVWFAPTDEERRVPAPFRLKEHRFAYRLRPLPRVSRYFGVADVTFPSPVETDVERNNTVHCEFYRPSGGEQRPAVVVLHILGGDFELSRLFCNALAHRGVAALFVKMPYYGPRSDPDKNRRMVSSNPQQTVKGITQAVLDIRRAVAWLAARPDVDANQLGVFGISMGGIVAALSLTAEPRLNKACLTLAGGDLPLLAKRSTRLAQLRREWEKSGRSEDDVLEVLRQVDPVTHASRVQGRRILMLNATDDQVIPRESTLSLWNSLRKPEIVWYRGGHYSVGWHIGKVLNRVTGFFSNTDGEQQASP